MKNKFIALISAVAMLLSMASAVFAAPEIPGVTIQSGTAYINGTVWDDPDGDDKYTAGTDTYIVDAAVSLLDANTREIVLMSSTDNNGYYSFETKPGDYILRFVLPEECKYHSMRTVEAGMGIGDYTDILGNRVAEFEETVADASVLVLESTIHELSNPPYVHGFVWYDDNTNGIRPAFYSYEDANDEGDNEVGIEGAVITVTNEDGQEIADGETDERGYYNLEIRPGVNTVRVTLPAAYQDYSFTIPQNGTVTLEFGSDEVGVDFGIAKEPLPADDTPTPTPNPIGTDTSPSPSSTSTPTPTASAEPIEPSASPDIKATEIPTPSDIPIPSQMPELNKTEHYAYVVGYPDGMIKPENNITRQEVASIFFRLLTDATRDSFYSKTNGFEDVTADMWSNTAISTMVQAGIIKGYDEKSFKPANNITRAEFATIAAKFDSSSYEGENKFNDIDGHWAAEYINRAAQKGWISGYENGSFRPDAYITRAEAMTLINNVLERHALESGMLEGMASWADNTPDKWYYIPVQEAANSHYYEKNEDGYETWTELRETRDWSELER